MPKKYCKMIVLKNPFTKTGVFLLVGVILLTSGVVYAQVSEPPVTIDNVYIPNDTIIREKTASTTSATNLPSLEAIKASMDQLNTEQMTQRLDVIIKLLQSINEKTDS